MQNVSENNIALGEVLVPQRLFNSVREGNLVIFAGSGVTKYGQKEAPLNEELAEQLGSPLGEKRHRDESIDAFLDRLKSYIPTIHEQYSKLLNNGILKPTDLHKVIIRLFKKSNLKIITTNQETLFVNCKLKVSQFCKVKLSHPLFRFLCLFDHFLVHIISVSDSEALPIDRYYC